MTRWAIALLALLAACAGPGRLEAEMGRYVGQPEAELLRGMGRPQRTWTLADGSRVLRFDRQRTVQYSGPLRTLDDPPREDRTAGMPTGTYDPAGAVFQPASAPAAPVDEANVCAVDFTVDPEGTVRAWSPRVGDCRAK